MNLVRMAICMTAACCLFSMVVAQAVDSIDPEALIQRILAVDQRQREQISDVVYDAEYVEGEEKDGEFREKTRFVKKIYVKYLSDTALYHEDYLEYYKDGKRKSDEDRDKEAKSRREDKKKRKSKDVSFSMLDPFRGENRQHYDIEYIGVTEDMIEGYLCHNFQVTSIEEVDDRINGQYYFDAESFNLVRVDFAPAKLVRRTFFKLKEMNMTIVYAPTEDGFWLPRQFEIEGKGKAMFLIGVKFSGAEYYRNPVINGGIEDQIFEEENGSELQDQDSEG